MMRAQSLPILFFGLALTLIYGLAFFVAGALSSTSEPGVVAAALTIDLAVMVPLLYCGLLMRRRRWPAVTAAPVFLLSLLAASLIVPADHQDLLQILRYLAAPVELLLLGYVGVQAARAAQHFRSRAAGEADVLERLRTSLRETLGARWAADVFAFEAGIFYYALFAWRAQPDPAPKHVAFSYHQRSGYGAVVAAILVVMLIELIALHLLLRTWSPSVAWVLTALSGYGICWLLGDMQAARLRPVLVEQDALVVRTGLRWTVRVPFAAIAWVRPAGKRVPSRKAPDYLEAVLLGKPAFLVAVKQPVLAQGLYGMRKEISVIGLAPDDAARFEAVLKAHYAAWQQDQV